MAAISSGVARPAVSSITETRYCISDHLLWFGAPSWAAAHPATNTSALRHRLPDVFKTFWYADCASAGCILRATCRPVDLERYALRECSRFDQVKRHVRAVLGEQPRALADDHGADEQVDLVDEVVLEQPPGQGAAAVHLQLTPRLGLQLADGRREVTGEDGRVRPARFGERVRCHVLGLCVQGTDDGVVQIFAHAPVPGEELVGPPAEQERVGALVHLVDEGHGLAAEQRPGPSAALESDVEHTRAAVCVHYSIDGDLCGGRQFHDRGSLLLGGPLVGGLSPLLRTPLSRSDAASRISFEDFLVRRL